MENIWLRFQAPKCVKHIQKQCNSRYITINNTPAKTSRRTGNRARENRVLQKKKKVFSLSEATIVVTWKVGNLDVQIWVFFGQMVFSLQ